MQSISDTTLSWAGQRSIQATFRAETQSTNDDAKDSALSEAEDLVIYLAGHQTQGRGRGAHVWVDTGAGENLLSTWSFHVTDPPQAITAPRVGLALHSAAAKCWPSLGWALKAPNDLILDGKKCGGLLVETVSDGSRHRLLIGLGLNVLNHPRKFVEATHLMQNLAPTLSDGEWFQFLDQLREEFAAALIDAQKHQLSDDSRRLLLQALNAHPGGRKFTQVTPQGDLLHKGGVISWTEL